MLTFCHPRFDPRPSSLRFADDMDKEDDRVRLAALRCWRQLLEALGSDLSMVTQTREP